MSTGVTGEIHFVDSGYNAISMPRLDELKAQEALNPQGPDADENGG
jgi:enoyl-[acyl-carrier protein] reductase I